jgi:hypothetical protein
MNVNAEGLLTAFAFDCGAGPGDISDHFFRAAAQGSREYGRNRVNKPKRIDSSDLRQLPARPSMALIIGSLPKLL